MKAVILASGEGRRLQPLTLELPKCMLDIGGRTILGFQLGALTQAGIEDIIITTGPFEEKVISHVSTDFPDINVRFVRNELYSTTNYIYSLWLTKEFIDDDVILLHGDVVFDIELLENLVTSSFTNCVPVKKMTKLPEKDFKAVVKDGKVTKIGVEFFGDDAYFSIPLYKFSRKDFLFWLEKIETFIKRGDTKIYAENVFNGISHRLKIRPLRYHDEFCMEIDTIEDLVIARKYFKERPEKNG